MVEKGNCDTCEHYGASCGEMPTCEWLPSELFTAYLDAVDRADTLRRDLDFLQRGHDTLHKQVSVAIAERNTMQGQLREAEARADKAEALAERFRQALNCPRCGGAGSFNRSWGGVVISNHNPKCPVCADIRKEACNG